MPSERKIELAPDAQRDLDAIFDPLYSAILKRLDLLTLHPQMGIALRGRLTGWCKTVVGIFTIIYRFSPRSVEVGYIRHCKRQMPGARASNRTSNE